MNKSEIMRVLLCLSRIEGKVTMDLDEYLSEELSEVAEMLVDKILEGDCEINHTVSPGRTPHL